MNILFVTTISGTMSFFPDHIRMLQEEGHTVELACNLDAALPTTVASLECKCHHIPFSRSPFSRDNMQAYQNLKRLLEENEYDIIHTHTPNASAIARLAAAGLRRKGLKVIYTAHGFHFFKGAPLKNWLLYYPVEWLLSWKTDALVTINKEDYNRAKKLGAKKVYYVPGVGIDTAKFRSDLELRSKKREELDLRDSDFMLMTVGELNANKNQQVVLRAMALLDNPDLHYVLCGKGPAQDDLERLAHELGVGERVHFLGYRTDVNELYSAADLYLCPSLREGLNVSIMEAMAAGFPVVCSKIRGNTDLVADGRNGLVVKNTPEDYAEAIRAILCDSLKKTGFAEMGKSRAADYDLRCILPQMREIYKSLIEDVEGLRKE